LKPDAGFLVVEFSSALSLVLNAISTHAEAPSEAVKVIPAESADAKIAVLKMLSTFNPDPAAVSELETLGVPTNTPLA